MQAGGREFESLYLHYSKIKDRTERQMRKDPAVHCTLKTAYVKHSFLDDTLNVRDRDENEALREQ